MATDGGLNMLLQSHLRFGWHWQRVETAALGAGVPDLNYCHGKFEGWLELKSCSGWRVTLRPEQYAWISRRIRTGGNVFVAARRYGKRPVTDELWLFCGCRAEQLLTNRLMVVQPLGCWYGGPAKWAWPEVAAVLTSRCEHAH